jgi:phosphoribosylformylglycinamidine synthase
MTIRICVSGGQRAASQQIVRDAHALGLRQVATCQIERLYFLAADLDPGELHQLCTLLLADPVLQQATWQSWAEEEPWSEETLVVEVALRPGVTDVTARELQRGMAELGLPTCAVATATRYQFGGPLTTADLHTLARQLLCNDTIERYRLGAMPPQFGGEATASHQVETVPLLELDDQALVALSRRRLLSLNLDEMRAIQSFYRSAEREPTDAELETLAQTWSEHCVHKTFRAQIDFTWCDAGGEVRQAVQVDSLLKHFIRGATEAVRPAWLRSAFVDNAGIIAFDDAYDLAFKVETHNHPSALEPFGGANTGVGGVVRDILGVSARPIATTDVLCFGPPNFPHHELPDGVLHPQRIAAGVVAGIGDYGNKLGLPTVNGAVLYHPGYLGNPLVFCGCVGLLPVGSHPTEPQVGDLVVVMGGRTGRDGIHGATFSSAELTHNTAETVGSAVQIGDPITEKGLIELVEAARNEWLYHAITDCGAGGLSSAIGEMGARLGVEVDLQRAPLKYPGLTPWEIWLSEAQERLVLAVPPTSLPRLQELADCWEVEISVLGRFTDADVLHVHYADQTVVDLPMHFLHDGLPRCQMQAVWQEPSLPTESPPFPTDLNALLLTLLAHPTIASKEAIVRRYDHEVRGGSLVRPFTGPQMDGPSDAALLKPLGTWQHRRAFTLSLGINPLLGQRDPYAMAVSVVDEAFRNAVAVGADPDQIALLDNFCWGNPTYPDRLGALVRTCQGCYDAALAYHAPFISGKDSLYNEFNGKPIPGTLLISAIGIAPDLERRMTSDLKEAGNWLYLLGETKRELGGSFVYAHLGYAGGDPPTMPHEPLRRYRLLHQAILSGWLRACHDLSEGGLAVALAEMALAGRLGVQVKLPTSDLADWEFLFAESNGRLLLEVRPTDAPALEEHFTGESLLRLGVVTATPRLVVDGATEPHLIDLSVEQLLAAWKQYV